MKTNKQTVKNSKSMHILFVTFLLVVVNLAKNVKVSVYKLFIDTRFNKYEYISFNRNMLLVNTLRIVPYCDFDISPIKQSRSLKNTRLI